MNDIFWGSMMSMKSRFRSIMMYVTMSIVLLCALGQLFNWHPFGVGAMVRSGMSLVGIAGAILLMCRYRVGWVLLLPWALLQTWVYIHDPSGQWFLQSMDIGWKNTTTITRNGQVTTYHGSGVNLAGLIWFLVFILMWALRVCPPQKPMPAIFKITQVRLLVIGMPVLVLAVWLGYFRYQLSQAPLVITTNFPGTLVYYQDQLLGRTPLAVTSEKILDWKLPLKAGQPLQWTFTDYSNRILIFTTDRKSEVVLDFKAPFYAPNPKEFPTPWGIRNSSTFAHGDMPERAFDAYLLNERPQEEYGMTLEFLTLPPYKPGQLVSVKCDVWNNGKHASGVSSTLLAIIFGFDRKWVTQTHPYVEKHPNRINMPEDWNDWPADMRRQEIVEVTMPRKPGYYSFQAIYSLKYGKKNPARFTGMHQFKYKLIEVIAADQ